MKKQRLMYLIAFMLLLVMEVLIAIYVHDNFIRPYMGDILVVIVIYCMIKIIIPKRHEWIPFWIFVFAVFTEALQYIRIVEVLGLENNRFFRILIGSTFDWKDIICYGIGCFFIVIYERKLNK